MNKILLKNTLELKDKQFNILKEEFSKSEKLEIIKSVVLGALAGKTVGQVISEISYNNGYLTDRNYKKLNEIFCNEKSLIATAFKEILREKFNLKTSDGGVI